MGYMGSGIIAYAQIILSATLVVVLLFVVFRQSKINERIDRFIESFESIISEQEEIALQFEKNLQDKKQIIENLLMRLDEKIKVGNELVEKISTLANNTVVENHTDLIAKNPEYEKILRLARKGFDAKTIARELQKPVGEVELVINIYKTMMK